MAGVVILGKIKQLVGARVGKQIPRIGASPKIVPQIFAVVRRICCNGALFEGVHLNLHAGTRITRIIIGRFDLNPDDPYPIAIIHLCPHINGIIAYTQKLC